MATITISIKDVVKNFDAFTEKIIADLYAWNMEFNPRKDIKGDFRCKARGVSSLVMKEIRMQALAQLTTTMTPEDWVYIPRREFLAEKIKAHDLNIRLRTEEEADKIREQESNSIMNQLQIEAIKAEISKDKAQAMVNLTKAKEKNVEAAVKAQTPIEQQTGADPRMLDEQLAIAQTDRMGKEAQIRREEESHALDMSHKDDDHRMKMGMEGAKAAQDMELKDRKAKVAEKVAMQKPKNTPKKGDKK